MNTPVSTETDVQMSLEQFALETLEEDIAFGRLHPRERLIEDDLMKRFGLKRHSVRNVLAELDRMGLVERHKHHGAFVVFYSLKEVLDLYVVRELLEAKAASLIRFPVDPERLERVIAIQREHDDAVDKGDMRRVFRTNLKFHNAFFELCDNGVLLRAIQEHARQDHPIRSRTLAFPDYRERSRKEHWGIIDALRNGDREKLVHLCREHLVPARDAYLDANRHIVNQ